MACKPVYLSLILKQDLRDVKIESIGSVSTRVRLPLEVIREPYHVDSKSLMR